VAISIVEAVAKLAEIEIALGVELRRALERGARIIEREPKREIGKYQGAAGPFSAWPKLANGTCEEREALGYAPPDNPLLRERDLRDSITHEVRDIVPGAAMEAEIGADGLVAVAQSLGAPSRNLPARDLLGHAAVRKEAEVVAELGDAVALGFGLSSGPVTKIR
jgi:hypothetical protein